MGNNHHAHVYNTLEEWLAALCDTPKVQKWGRARWKEHIDKHGNVPMIRKCSVCSGADQKLDIKHGKYKPSRPSKSERDYRRGKE